MPAKLYRVKLNDKDREYLQNFVSKGEAKAREINRARILLLADEGEKGLSKKDKEIAEVLGVCMRTVATIREKYVKEGIKGALHEKPRPGQPPKLSSRDEAQLTVIACSSPPEGHSRWTLRMLSDRLVELDIVDNISHEGVRKILKKTPSNHGKRNSGA